jgi:hypothetical protein
MQAGFHLVQVSSQPVDDFRRLSKLICGLLPGLNLKSPPKRRTPDLKFLGICHIVARPLSEGGISAILSKIDGCGL